ncbi:Protein NLRC3 [Labeo rohita]|uniref:Protein NLRC3 n=1 Tax=Labeo rohita TaxID=84645 RepID=A0ABQ8L606_LABRO|nr:Protein NLRC3 [Labeo rohita]
MRGGEETRSSVSVKRHHSKGEIPNFEETPSFTKCKEQKTTVNIGLEFKRWQTLKAQKKLNSDVELATFLLNRVQYEKADIKKYRYGKHCRENLHWIFQDFTEDMYYIKEAALDITLYFLKDMKLNNLADTLKDELIFTNQQKLIKSNLRKKYKSVSEGFAKQGDSKPLNNIYTDLYITQCCCEQVNTEHEVRQTEVASRHSESQEIQIECTKMFEVPEHYKEIRTVLTKGVADIGKSVSVQKFVLDWAEGKENQDISFIFPLPFREMNVKEKEKQSLMSLLRQFFPGIRELNLTRNDKFKVLFIFDGLDECRLPLNFKGNETCCDVSSPASLDVLLTNLIKGNLLPSALIWITTRPAAASKIPPDCIDRVTEIRGFSEAQMEKYFKKRFMDENLANKVTYHVKKSKSIFIMCHIPIFCWISSTVLQTVLEEKINDVKNKQADDASKIQDIPKTLTQMYTHYFCFQIQQRRRNYDEEYTPDIPWDKDAILSLGKLAFHQLEKNYLIFYESDLEACGIDVCKASVYSGMCTQILKEETGIITTMYYFAHKSIQEFFAALYAHLFLDINKKSVFVHESKEHENKKETMIDFLKTAVDKTLKSDNGHLDLFLRFLLGLSLQSSRQLLQGLLSQQDCNDQSKMEIVEYIKQKFEDNLSPDRSINLFYCLNELNDQTLVEEIKIHLSKGSLSSADLSPAQWSALTFVFLTSEEELDEFELQKFKKSDECLVRLSPVIKTSKRAL